ncbi:MAG: DUF1893 domain-containing protein [Paramuribaculum sp.]|nr:DUF1893 domain-containing protein [Paramuribaculum sp.]
MDISSLTDILHSEKCSCVIFNHGDLSLYHRRGVKDLYELLIGNPSVLDGALVADKVIGKGAAALMIVGKVKSVYADVISNPALELFNESGVSVKYAMCVPNIINRAGNGICPVETLCLGSKTAEECIPYIKSFINQQNQS